MLTARERVAGRDERAEAVRSRRPLWDVQVARLGEEPEREYCDLEFPWRLTAQLQADRSQPVIQLHGYSLKLRVSEVARISAAASKTAHHFDVVRV